MYCACSSGNSALTPTSTKFFPNSFFTWSVYRPKHVLVGDLSMSLVVDREGVSVLVLIIVNNRFTLCDPHARTTAAEATSLVAFNVLCFEITDITLLYVVFEQSIEDHVMHQGSHEFSFLSALKPLSSLIFLISTSGKAMSLLTSAPQSFRRRS
jgi:hypothetical protein